MKIKRNDLHYIIAFILEIVIAFVFILVGMKSSNIYGYGILALFFVMIGCVLFEFIQKWTKSGNANVEDIIRGWVGAIVGFVVYVIIYYFIY